MFCVPNCRVILFPFILDLKNESGLIFLGTKRSDW